jgi:hypothetical protein
MSFHLAFSGSNFGKPFDSALEKVIDPASSLGNRVEQRVARV